MTSPVAAKRSTVLLVHPSPDMCSSDRVFAATVEALVQAGHRAVVALPEPGPLADHLRACGADIRFNPTCVLRRSYLTPGGISDLLREAGTALRANYELIRAVAPDVVVVNTLTLPVWPLVAKLAGVRLVVHAHEAESQVNRLLWWGLTRGAALADTVIANSRHTEATLHAAGGMRPGRTVMIYNPVPDHDPAPAPRLPARDEPLRLLYVGRLSHRKGVHTAIAALDELRGRGVDATLDIVGDVFSGYEWYEKELHTTIAARGLEQVVRFHGFSENPTTHYDACHIALVPATGPESFGNTLVEPLLRCRPVVASEHSGLAEAGRVFHSVEWSRAEQPATVADAVQRITTRAAENPNRFTEHLTADRRLAIHRHARSSYGRDVAAAITRGRLAPATGQVAEPAPSIMVAALTYRRNDLLPQLIPALIEQAATIKPTAQVLIVDNDPDGGAQDLATDLLGSAGRYVYCGRGGIAEGRNRVLEDAADAGVDAVVFIDDDETPAQNWLRLLVQRYQMERPAGVVGPVIPDFMAPVPRWIDEGKLFITGRRPTGTLMPMAATNNLLLDVATIEKLGLRFDAGFSKTGGSDSVLTGTLTHAGHRIVWVDEAEVTDLVPAARLTPSWVARRAFRLANCGPRVADTVLKRGQAQKLSSRPGYFAAGIARIAAGSARAAYGAATANLLHRGQGIRTAIRGLGLAAASMGYHYREYKPAPAANNELPQQRSRDTKGTKLSS